MAIAGRWLAARYNKHGFMLFDFNVWTQCSDGDLMEGVTNEAASLGVRLVQPLTQELAAQFGVELHQGPCDTETGCAGEQSIGMGSAPA